MELVTRSVLTCPVCGGRTEQEMPTNACVRFFDCPSCDAPLQPEPGDCCVFCSFGSVKCPPMQGGGDCC